ncbi:MAG: hypothetical protein WCP92_05680 [bacterium]
MSFESEVDQPPFDEVDICSNGMYTGIFTVRKLFPELLSNRRE